jgi:putative colanic acid biosynthesis acetyltransferase WcaF
MQDKTGKELSSNQILNKVAGRIYSYLSDFSLMIIRFVGLIPFHHIRRFVYRIAGMQIWKGSSIHIEANFFSLKKISIGEDTVIGYRCFLDGRDKIMIGNHVAMASEVMIYNSQHDIDNPDFKASLAPVMIEDYVFIGPRAIILPGVKIGQGAVIAAGAVVAESVELMTVVGGVPAKFIRKRKLGKLAYKIGRARWFQ